MEHPSPRPAPSSASNAAPLLGDLAPLVGRLAGRRVLVHADLVADEFIETASTRVSREAPVLILEHRGSRIVPGGGANAASNIAALGGIPVVVGEVGDDEAGRAVVEQLERLGADVEGIIVRSGGVTPRKTRILAGDRHVALQQVVRIDRIEPFIHDEAFLRDVKAAIVRLLPSVEGVLVSDYGLGFVDPESVAELLLRSPERARLCVALDSRHRLFEYRGVDVAAPSEPELEQALDRSLAREEALERAGRDALERLAGEALVLTRGSLGLRLFVPGEPALDVPAFGATRVTDVTGAGDTVVATLSLARAAGASWSEAARLSNVAAGIVITKMGTATVGPEELTAALTGNE